MSRFIFFILASLFFTDFMRSQTYYSQTYEFGDDIYPQNELLKSIVDQDTLYALSIRRCPSGNCTEVSKININNGEILAERLFDWFNPGYPSKDVMIRDGEKIVISGKHGFFEEARYDLLVLNTGLDSIAHFEYAVEGDIEYVGNKSVISFGEYYIILGFTNTISDPLPSNMLWINKGDYSLDTIGFVA
ncbi:MAG: hypothetical protein H6577_18910 [Lewinellaceae bacterium]|nr:hypothetical protein [Saprospiraceae bacterium]MCB9340197.1 hypothetical protein [Lewinellaceae bacterium]